MNTTVLTNMCLIKNKEGQILLQNRVKKDWPGLNLPGGHVEGNEYIINSVTREIKEETGLIVNKIHCVGYYEWLNPSIGRRDLAILFIADEFSGDLKSNEEGENSFYDIKEIKKHILSTDLEKILLLFGIRI